MIDVERHKELVRAVISDVFNAHDLDALDRYYAKGYLDHNPLIRPGVEGYRSFFEPFFAAFPDVHGVIEDVIAEGDRVVVRTTWRGTHRGELLGVAATNRSVSWQAIDIFRIHDGRVAEHWDVVDTLAILQQLGLLDAMGPGNDAPDA